MIAGAHFLLYSTNPEADRAFFRDVLELAAVDVGGGWLIFRMPPAELGIHPSDGKFLQKHGDNQLLGSLLFLMCHDVRSTVKSLQQKGIACADIIEEDWGFTTTLRLPSGGRIGLYQPTHPTAIPW